MRFNLTKEEMHDHLKVKKAALISIAINVLEIVAGIVMLTLVRRMLLGGVEESIVRMVSLMCFTIVGWGALTDIGASLTSLRMVRRTQELEEAYSQLEDLNREMRAQRHDFMNHIQVVYSLIEMNEPGELLDPLAPVSMNFWGFTPWIFGKLEEYFATFLKGLAPDAIKAECLLPVFVDELMHEGELTVPMLTTDAVWFGVTYKEDKPFVQAELRKLHESGVYPASLHE